MATFFKLGKTLRAKFNKAEQKAVDYEIGQQAAAFEKLHADEHDAMILWVLHSEYGWGEKRLRQFWDKYRAAHMDLIRRYETYDSAWEDAWVCQHKLKEAGIDISQWPHEWDIRKETDPHGGD